MVTQQSNQLMYWGVGLLLALISAATSIATENKNEPMV